MGISFQVASKNGFVTALSERWGFDAETEVGELEDLMTKGFQWNPVQEAIVFRKFNAIDMMLMGKRVANSGSNRILRRVR